MHVAYTQAIVDSGSDADEGGDKEESENLQDDLRNDATLKDEASAKARSVDTQEAPKKGVHGGSQAYGKAASKYPV